MTDATDLSALQRELLDALLRGKEPAVNEPMLMDDSTPSPLSFPQLRLWFLDKLSPGGTAYNTPIGFRVKGVLDVVALEKAVNVLLERHGALRTRFFESDGQPMQVVMQPKYDHLQVEDMNGATDRELQLRISEDGRMPFELTATSQFKLSVLGRSPTDHVLLISGSHMVMDGYSLGIFMQELNAVYAAIRDDIDFSLPTLTSRYVDFARWQRSEEYLLDRQNSVQYWRNQLKGIPTAINLPYDRKRPIRDTQEGGLIKFHPNQDELRLIHKIGAELGATPFMSVIAVYYIFLSKMSGDLDIVVGTPVANRLRKQDQLVVGFFANTLALRVVIDPTKTFREILQVVRDACFEAYEHQEVPFERLVAELNPDRIAGANPLFQTMFLHGEAPTKSMEFGNDAIVASMEVGDTGGAKFDIWMSILFGDNAEDEGSSLGILEYNSDIFEKETAQRFVDIFLKYVSLCSQDTNRSVDSMYAQSDDDASLLGYWSVAPEVTSQRDCATIIDALRANVVSNPDRVALQDESQTITYRELLARVEIRAMGLREYVGDSGHTVGVHLERNLDRTISILAVMASGNIFVPLDPEYPTDRLAYICHDAGLKILISKSDEPWFEKGNGVRLLLDAEAGYLCEAGSLWPTHLGSISKYEKTKTLNPASVAYILYTSGSTGMPKGAMISHAALLNRLSWMGELLGIGPDDRILHKTPIGFDVSVWEVLLPFYSGCRSVVARPNGHMDPAYLHHLIKIEGVTLVHFVPSMLSIFCAQEIEECTSLRHVICSGEELGQDVANEFDRRLPARIYNMYGPTEAAIDVSYWKFEPIDLYRNLPIGCPAPRVELHVLDKSLKPAPIGVDGELYIGGIQVGYGYKGRPSLTSERFIANPVGAVVGDRLYRSGDIARWNNHGLLEYIGRADSQLKVNGVRIEPAEIELSIRRSGLALEAAAALLDSNEIGGNIGKELVAFVVPSWIDLKNEVDDFRGDMSREWSMVFDHEYSSDLSADGSISAYSGWVSSYTGSRIPDAEMEKWLHSTVRIVSELAPHRILDIGAGSGLFLRKLASGAGRYHGIDSSEFAISKLESSGIAKDDHVTVAVDDALTLGSVNEKFDCVLINSVCQYLPDIVHLENVIGRALSVLSDGGSIVIGDVRHYGLLDAFYSDVAIFQADSETPVDVVFRQVLNARVLENEFVVDPSWFTRLPELFPSIKSVEIRKRLADYGNELTEYRYDVVVGTRELENSPTVEWVSLERISSKGNLEDLFSDSGRQAIGVRDIPDLRMQSLFEAWRILSDPGVNPRDPALKLIEDYPISDIDSSPLHVIVSDAESLGFKVDCCYSSTSSSHLDIVIRRAQCMRPVMPLEKSPRHQATQFTFPLQRKLSDYLQIELRQRLAEFLPTHSIPTRIVAVSQIPLSANGKVDRGALPSLLPTFTRSAEYVAPRNETEHELAEVWSIVLGLEKVGISDDFFSLGGDSIRSIEVISRARKLGILLDPVDIFQFPTIEGLVGRARSVGSGGVVPDSMVLELQNDVQIRMEQLLLDSDIEEVFPVSYFQEELIDCIADSASTGMCFVQRADRVSEIDPERFKKSWFRVSERFATMRTSFDVRASVPLAVVHRRGETEVVIVDWRDQPEEERTALLTKYLHEERTEWHSHFKPRGFRCLLARIGENQYIQAVCFSYLLADGWTMGLIMDAVRRDYIGLEFESPTSYRQYVHWQRSAPLDRASMEKIAHAIRDNHLAGNSFLAESPLNVCPEGSGTGVFSVLLASRASSTLDRVSRELKVSPSVLVNLAWALALADCLGTESVCFGAFVSGRSADCPDLETIAGPTMNILPVCVNTLSDRTLVSDLTRSMHEVAIDRMKVESAPVSTLLVQNGLGLCDSLFESFVIYQNLDPALFKGESRMPVFFTKLKYPIRVDVLPGVQIRLAMSFARGLYDEQLISRVLTSFAMFLSSANGLADSTIGDWRNVKCSSDSNLEISRMDDGLVGEFLMSESPLPWGEPLSLPMISSQN